MTERTLSFDELQIAPDDVFEQMGYSASTSDDATSVELRHVIDDVRQWLHPRFCFFVVAQLPPFDMGSIIERQLRRSEAYALFVCTAGAEYEAYLQRLKDEGDMVRTYIADALGSVVAEKCADQMELHLQQSIDKLGWHRTNRFSPGYCGWHVSQQQLLFPLFQGHTCGVCLTDSSLMLPIKSVSGIIGLGAQVSRQPYTCGLCDFSQCFRRKVRQA